MVQCIREKVFDFFSNYAPSEVEFSRLSGIDCAKPFFEIRPETTFSNLFQFWSIYGPDGAKIEISSQKRVPGRISKNGLVQSIPERQKNST